MESVASGPMRVPRRSAPSSPLYDDTSLGQCNSRLENLPSELHRQIISTLTLDLLNDLIHASPIFFQEYLRDRTRLLCRCLRNTLGSATVDGLAVHESSTPSFQSTRSRESVFHILDSFRNMRIANDDTAEQKLCEPNAAQMVTFYSRVIRPITRNSRRLFASIASLKRSMSISSARSSQLSTKDILKSTVRGLQFLRESSCLIIAVSSALAFQYFANIANLT
ncbi:hypothetical protein F4677DRAFT_436330 [Hypoxylon crocopeplum]|nr:hypothetical protein F4677DRAFT_436330 [Hypoxylon crocopeplum]